jgi:heterotetrameric sarcosine oxidase delta subunit
VTFLIDCPNCGPREALEFSYGGERTRRAGPDASDHDLAGYLFFRENVNGWQTEWWLHRDGCRRWFLAERHTGTNEVRRTFWPGEGPKAQPDQQQGTPGDGEPMGEAATA